MIFVGEESNACAVRFDKNEATKMNEFEEFDKFRKKHPFKEDPSKLGLQGQFKMVLKSKRDQIRFRIPFRKGKNEIPLRKHMIYNG